MMMRAIRTQLPTIKCRAHQSNHLVFVALLLLLFPHSFVAVFTHLQHIFCNCNCPYNYAVSAQNDNFPSVSVEFSPVFCALVQFAPNFQLVYLSIYDFNGIDDRLTTNCYALHILNAVFGVELGRCVYSQYWPFKGIATRHKRDFICFGPKRTSAVNRKKMKIKWKI